jgi:hypothetical protein
MHTVTAPTATRPLVRYLHGARCAGSSQLINISELGDLNEDYKMDYRYVQFIAAGPKHEGNC